MPVSVVPGFTQQRPIFVVDLDGTVLTVNSFRRWGRYVLRARFPHRRRAARLGIAGRAAAAIVERKLGLADHERFKRRLLLLWREACAGDSGVAEARFVTELLRFVRPELRPLLADIAARRVDAVLATAAADYADAVGRALGFDHVVYGRSGAAKRDAVRALLARQGWQDRPRVVLTDHVDDLPLMRDCQTVHWFGAASLPRIPEVAMIRGWDARCW